MKCTLQLVYFLFLLLKVHLSLAGAGVYLAINALAYVNNSLNDGFDVVVKRRLEVNWYGVDVMEGDRIVVTDQFSEVIAFSPSQYPDGFFILPGNLPYPTLSEMGYVPDQNNTELL